MEPTDVLRKYVELCSSSNVYLQYHLGQNSALDWYGRTIRGRHRIQQFVRYDVCQQYEHNFQRASVSGPIECKPSHLQTRKIFKEAEIEQTPDNNKTDLIVLHTPPKTSKIPELPELNQGKSFLPLTDDSFEDIRILETDATTPPRSEPISKRPKLELTPPLPNVDDYFGIPEQPHRSIADKMDLDDSNFSHIMYIEAKGIIQRLNQTKHRGMAKLSSTAETSPTSHIRSNSSIASEKETVLKISYRIRLLDNQVQFALIIYEQISRNLNLRRNLFMEFNDIEEKEKNIEKQQTAPSKEIKKRKTPLKRNLRLF